MKGIYLLLGTNIGDRIHYLNTAIQLLNLLEIKAIRKSAIYESEAWGKEDQQSFLNQVIEVETRYDAHKLLDHILAVEKQMGRVRFEKWAERIIDIDILFFNNKQISSALLTIPHPLIQERNFTLIPLAELIPNENHPVFKVNISKLLENCTDPLSVKKLAS